LSINDLRQKNENKEEEEEEESDDKNDLFENPRKNLTTIAAIRTIAFFAVVFKVSFPTS
jgi:hypothetical protein